jgi:CheY-like chemotaxis protein
LQACPAFRPDVVILDLAMPAMTGWEVDRRLRERQEGRTVLLVALTGYGQEGDKRRAREAGCHAPLVKPCDPLELDLLLRAAARGSG